MPIEESKLNVLRKYKCLSCGKIIYSNRLDVLFCSNSCRQKMYRRRHNSLHNGGNLLNEKEYVSIDQNSNNQNPENMKSPFTKEENEYQKQIMEYESKFKWYEEKAVNLLKENETLKQQIKTLQDKTSVIKHKNITIPSTTENVDNKDYAVFESNTKLEEPEKKTRPEYLKLLCFLE